MRSIATRPRVAQMMINALKFGTPAKVYDPLIASETQKIQEQ